MILCIDYGVKNVGLAISDADEKVAMPLLILHKGRSNFVEDISNIIQERGVTKIIIGMPQKFAEGYQGAIDRIEKFKSELESFLTSNGVKVSIDYADETFSTVEAMEYLKDLGYNTSKAREVVDMYAAVEILRRILK